MKKITIKNKEHTFRTIVLKSAKIDVNIIPVVKWINSFPDTITFYSCQGGPANYGFTSIPYATFICREKHVLKHITNVVKKFNINVETDKPRNEYMFLLNILRFPEGALDKFKTYLKKNRKECYTLPKGD